MAHSFQASIFTLSFFCPGLPVMFCSHISFHSFKAKCKFDLEYAVEIFMKTFHINPFYLFKF